MPRESQIAGYLRRWIVPGCRSVLDVGCGEQARLIRLVPGIAFSVGVDAKVPEVARELGVEESVLDAALDYHAMAKPHG